MTIEYSNELKGVAVAYRFTDVEKQNIAMGLKTRVYAIERKIERIKNHPKNEGQAKYDLQIQSLRFLQDDLREIIKEFS